MFTEGLDETAIQWINKGSQQQQRSPLSENLTLPLSPLLPTLSNNLTPKSPSLPPLKFFHSPLLPPPNLAFGFPDHHPDDDDDSVSDDDYDESVASLHCPVVETDDDDDEENEDERVLDSLDTPIAHCYDEDQLFGFGNGTKPRTLKQSGILRKGLVNENLTIQLPNSLNVRRFTDGELGFNKCVQKKMTPCGTGTGVVRFQNDPVELNTPSAPPIFVDGESGDLCYSEDSVANVVDEMPQPQHRSWPSRESVNCDNEGGVRSECSIEQKSNTVSERQETTSTQDIERQTTPQLQYLNTSGCNSQHAWQTLITYDACIRLCLQAWARGCTEAPEFLKDECLALRSAFGLHEFLLQPRGMKPTEGSAMNSEQTVPLKTKKVVGKIRVEVKKLRIIQRRKLRSSFSNRGSMYKQAGMEYVRHVSSLVKSGINSMKSASFSAAAEESMYCLIQLKSATEENASESCSAIFLRPGSGDYHDFFPLSQGDALLVEIQDSKKAVHGEARIPISYLNDNPSDRIRWWPINHDDNECVGKIQLSIGSTMTSDDNNHIKSAPVVETQAYDIVLEGAMRAQRFHSRNLRLNGPWKWLLDAFADYYGVSSSYSKLRYLLQVMNVATPTKDCLELVKELLDPLMKARSERSLTRQERSILLDCETQIEGLLATVFENYKSLDENSPTGLTDHFGPASDSAAPALHPALQVYSSLHDILSPEAQTILQNYLQTAARKRCRKHMMETDEFVSGASESYLMDTITISTAYLKMKNLCISIRNEIQADIKINGQNTIHGQHIFPSSIDLANITAAIYSTELCKRLRTFLSAWPPSSPQPHVNELLVATADFERDLESWNISSVQGGVDSRNLFHNYIMVWIQDMQLGLLDLCKAEKVPWAGVTTNHSTSPFAEKMYDNIKDNLIQYEVVINRWPQYSLYLENAVANVERAIVKSLEKQYSDILTPLKDSIPKRLHLQVQKLARRQSASVQLVPNQLGIFLNTIKRILDVLHCRVEDILNSWARCLPVMGDKKLFGEQMNGITVLLRTRYKTYLQAIIGNLVNNIQGNKSTRLKKMLEETREADGEAEVRERMQLLNSQLVDFISNLHEVFTSQIFIAICRGLWDRMGQIILKFLEGRKENRIWYNGSCYALGILDDTFASQMQRLKGNALHEKDIEPPRSVIEARSILCKDTTNANDTSTYFYI
ncbi:pesticidal crystal cry8Ba protein [Trifolium repens]|nr:pesticidal crystal cry8Ba protein [Trifolium repens]